MQTVGPQLTAVLQSPVDRSRDLITLFELYDSDYDPSASGFDPRSAIATFSGVSFTLPFGPVTYRRQVLEVPSVKKTMGKEFNTATVRFSNLSEDANGSRYMAQFVLTRDVEHMRLVIRVLSPAVAEAFGNNSGILANSIIVFAGRCQKPDGFNRSVGTLTAKPDLGTIEAQIPPRQFQASCPLEFKGTECLGSETLIQKSATYQAAVLCNKTFQQCTDYANTEFFQGTRIIQITSSFVHKSNESFFKKILNILPGISRKKTTVNNSLHDGTPYGRPIPLIFGRWYKVLLPLQFQDVGTSIKFLMAACRGKISDFINLYTHTLNFSQPLGVVEHLGEYGGVGSQTQDTVFPEQGFFSRLAYITGYCTGTQIDVEDPAPEISAVVAGIIPDSIYHDTDHDGTGKLAAGTGGVTTPGSSTTAPGIPAASYDADVAARNPAAYWKLEEALSSDPVTDSSGNGFTGEYVVGFGLTLQETHPIETDLVSYGAKGAVAAYPPFALAPSTMLGTDVDLRDDFTIVAWARMLAPGAQSTIIGRGGDTPGFWLGFGTGLGTQSVHARISWDIEGSFTLDTGLIVPQDGTWHQVVWTRQGTVLSLYFDGCLAARRGDLPTGPIVSADYDANRWRIGYASNLAFGAVWWSDGVSHVQLYKDDAWSEQDVSDNYASAKTIPTGCPGEDWTDNPVDHTRYILTEPSLMANDDASIDDYLSSYAAAFNTGAIQDTSNAERCLLPNTEVTKAGTDYRRYNSTGLLGPRSFESTRTQIPAGVPNRELVNVGAGGNAIGEYEFYDPAAPPTSTTNLTAYRKRFTCNIEISEVRKAVDFLYDTIFPTFRGFLRWNAKGQTVIDNERPADFTTLRSASLDGATTLTVQDVLPWKNTLGSPYLLEGKAHIAIYYSYTYNNAAERTAATGFVSGDIGKYAFQEDTKTTWELTATTPTWAQITQDTSEVRPVILAEYSSLGDAITLAASAAGGPSAVASGATLTGGSATVQSSGTVTITGTLADGASITVTIDGTACVLDLVNGEASSTIGHRMAAVINATPNIRDYVEAHATNNVVTIYAKVGVLTLASALEEPHSVFSEVTRVMMSFAGKALTYADTTKANLLNGTFGWPDASRQSLVNQIKTKYRESVRDFGEQPLVTNDYIHQRKTRKVNVFEVDHYAVDNYNQSARLSNGLLNKLRDGDRFFGWGSAGEALLLDEGDVVCVSDDSGPFRNVLVRIEDIIINNRFEASFVARKYSRLQLNDLAADPVNLQLASGLVNFQAAPPNISFNTTDFPPNGLVQATTGTAGITSIRGGAIFGASIYGQYANVRVIVRGGVAVNELIAVIRPDSNLKAVFEFIASVDGLYTVELEVCNNIGVCNTTKPTASIIIGFGSLFGLARENGDLILRESGATDILEREN